MSQEAGNRYDPRRLCRRCAQEGHFARECPNPPVLFYWVCGNRGRSSQDCCRRKEAGNGQRRRQASSGSAPIHKGPGPPLKVEGGRVVATVEIGGQTMPATIEPGATRSSMSEDCVRKCAIRGRTEDVQGRIRLADGSTLEVGKTLRLDASQAGEMISMVMLIMPSMLYHVILGMDFLGAMGTTIRCGKGELAIDSKRECLLGSQRKRIPRGNRRKASQVKKREHLLGNRWKRPRKRQRERSLSRNGASPGDGVLPGGGETEGESNIEEAEAADLDPELREFLESELALFEGLQGVSHIAEHRIRLKDDKPLKQRYYPKNPAMQRTGEWRMCIDYRQLNAHSIPDAYPVPRFNHILERLRHARFISTLDLKHGYWQIPMAADSWESTAFTGPGRGLFQWRVMPFGLHSACATFQRALDTVIGPEMEPHAFAYLDDIVVIGATKEQHVENLREVFRRLRAANLRLNRRKCSFFRERLVYLGHVICGEGIRTDPEKVDAIRNLTAPTNCKELRQCLGMTSWYRRFVPKFATQVQLLTVLLKKGRWPDRRYGGDWRANDACHHRHWSHSQLHE
ncbi:uncharacterized protein LOC135439595 [Drosophila montana]|uniref:uncharacterized protein LOC135439595 n=1 Tax=Drosophila montana TaxID=40370 RepID=UPI00313D6B51